MHQYMQLPASNIDQSKENNSTVALTLTLQVYDKYKFRLANYHPPYPLDISGKNVFFLVLGQIFLHVN